MASIAFHSLTSYSRFCNSERADSTGATGDRLKEGSAINQSLSSLGNVIKGESFSHENSLSYHSFYDNHV